MPKKFVFDVKDCTNEDIDLLARMVDEDFYGFPKGTSGLTAAIIADYHTPQEKFKELYDMIDQEMIGDSVWRQPLEMMPLWINDSVKTKSKYRSEMKEAPTIASTVAKWRLQMSI